MSIRWRIGLTLVALSAVYVAADHTMQRSIMAPHFAQLEQQAARADMSRAVQALDNEARHLSIVVRDWGTWDDTYEWVADHNREYREDNLEGMSSQSAGVDTIIICNKQRQIVWHQTYDYEADTAIPMPEFSGSTLPADMASLYQVQGQHDDCRGVVLTRRGPMLIASRPILTNTGSGPSRGIVVMGRFLTAAAVARMAEQAGIKLSLHLLSTAPPEARAALAHVSEQAPDRLVNLDSHRLRVYRSLAALDGSPLAALQVDCGREITEGGARVIRHSLRSLTGAGVAALLALMLLLEAVVIGPVSKLTRHVVEIGKTGNLEARLNAQRRDEVGVLSRELDGMSAELHAARQRLVGETYREGMAEMASGLLHNIRNMLSAVVVQSEEARDSIRPKALEKLRQALEELQAKAAPPERAQALEKYVQLSALRLLNDLRASHESLASVCEQTRRMDELLCEQERAGRTELRTEAIPLKSLVHGSLALTSDLTRQALRLEVDDEALEAAGSVQGSRMPLMLVIANLLTNAVEASALSGRSEVGVRISAGTNGSADNPQTSLSVTDDGPGIAADVLGRLFERGFSTKSSNRGLGLHWSANVVHTMGGQIRAASDGPGQGAQFDVVLPRVM